VREVTWCDIILTCYLIYRLSTIKKNNQSVIGELNNVLKEKPYIPVGCGMVTD